MKLINDIRAYVSGAFLYLAYTSAPSDLKIKLVKALKGGE